MMEKNCVGKVYLGDAVYAAVVERESVVLTTEEGGTKKATNTIYLKPDVLNSLLAYMQQLLPWQGRADFAEFCGAWEKAAKSHE